MNLFGKCFLGSYVKLNFRKFCEFFVLDTFLNNVQSFSRINSEKTLLIFVIKYFKMIWMYLFWSILYVTLLESCFLTVRKLQKKTALSYYFMLILWELMKLHRFNIIYLRKNITWFKMCLTYLHQFSVWLIHIPHLFGKNSYLYKWFFLKFIFEFQSLWLTWGTCQFLTKDCYSTVIMTLFFKESSNSCFEALQRDLQRI